MIRIIFIVAIAVVLPVFAGLSCNSSRDRGTTKLGEALVGIGEIETMVASHVVGRFDDWFIGGEKLTPAEAEAMSVGLDIPVDEVHELIEVFHQGYKEEPYAGFAVEKVSLAALTRRDGQVLEQDWCVPFSVLLRVKPSRGGRDARVRFFVGGMYFDDRDPVIMWLGWDDGP
jgi:hypothetical protein